ncbi:hypothetical protein ACHHYP_20234 [Achlya hypogyna]|uniref:Uncharacterized protein n=1 Tax=Achlya hypogyna TaxID=1202772 RepID=A0A1V9YWW5_ACHHY|nr:hypothetical protein ACHHYP_20234 [Achlya hypogyna]
MASCAAAASRAALSVVLIVLASYFTYNAVVLAAATVDPMLFVPLFVVFLVIGIIQSLPVAVHAMQDVVKPCQRPVVVFVPAQVV